MAVAKKQLESLDDLEDPQTLAEQTEDIDITEDDSDDEEGGAELEGELPEGKPTRKERRGQRQRDHEEKIRKEYEERDAQRARELEATRLELARVNGSIEALTRQQPQKDPLEAALEDNQKRTQRLFEIYEHEKSAITPERERELGEELRTLQEQKQELLIDRRMGQRGLGRQENPRAVQTQMLLEEDAPDILRAPANVRQWGLSRWQQLLAEGKADNRETMNLAAEDTRRHFRMESRLPGARERPLPDRRSLISHSSNGGGGGVGPERTLVTMTPEYKAMARALYPNKDPREAYKLWAKDFAKNESKQRA